MVHSAPKGKLVGAKEALGELLKKAGGAVSIVSKVFDQEAKRINDTRPNLEGRGKYGNPEARN